MGLALAVAARALGYSGAAWGIAGGTPIGLVNYLLTMPLARHGAPKDLPRNLAWRLPLRFLLAVGGLLVGLWIGVETMIGVVIGETLEVLLYTVAAAGIALRTLLGRLRSGHV